MAESDGLNTCSSEVRAVYLSAVGYFLRHGKKYQGTGSQMADAFKALESRKLRLRVRSHLSVLVEGMEMKIGEE